MVASKGKATGIVKVINKVSEFAHFQKGDILVSAMTRPEFLPIMEKAAAIVTDEGGITSHAAIVSRELGIPCIIGTQTATRVLKTGQKVQVDALKGIVSVLK
jgi:pyruvate,water dikinase